MVTALGTHNSRPKSGEKEDTDMSEERFNFLAMRLYAGTATKAEMQEYRRMVKAIAKTLEHPVARWYDI